LPWREANAPFVLAFHAGRWTVRKDGKVVPSLVRFAMEPGLFSVGESMRGDYGAVYDHLSARAKRAGMVVLHPNSGPPGQGGYVTRVDAVDRSRRPVVHYAPKWERHFTNSALAEVNHELMDAYLAHWVEAGLIPATPDYPVIVGRIGDLSTRLDRAAARDIAGRKSERTRGIEFQLQAWQRCQKLAEGRGDVEPDAPPPSRDLVVAEAVVIDRPEPVATSAPATAKPAKSAAAKGAKKTESAAIVPPSKPEPGNEVGFELGE
jgi:hypothetical protein